MFRAAQTCLEVPVVRGDGGAVVGNYSEGGAVGQQCDHRGLEEGVAVGEFAILGGDVVGGLGEGGGDGEEVGDDVAHEGGVVGVVGGIWLKHR